MYKKNKNRIHSLLPNGVPTLDKTHASTMLLAGLLVGGVAVTGVAKAEESVIENSAMDEIIVTAQRKEQSVLDIPSALDLVTGEQIRDQLLTTSHALELSTPGLTFHSVSGTSQVTLRGVGTGYSGPALGNSIALYVDDSYISNQVGAVEVFFDMDRVEVLKGPQSSLYGRNATGGAIQFLTNKPTLDAAEGHVEMGYAELETTEFDGVINLPLNDKFAVRLAGKLWDRAEGHVTNINTGDKITGYNKHTRLRGQLLYQPNDDFSAIFKYEDGSSQGDEPLRRQNAIGTNCTYCTDGVDGSTLGWYETNQTPLAVSDVNTIREQGMNPMGGNSMRRDTTHEVFALNMDWAINDAWTLVSRTQLREVVSMGGQDQDASPIDYQTAFSAKSPNEPDGIVYESLTQELRLVSDLDGPFNVTGGLAYVKDDNQFAFGLGGDIYNAAKYSVTNFDDIESLAVYAEVYYDMTDRMTLTLGGRYTDDEVIHGVKYLFEGQDVSHGDKFNKFTGRMALNYRADWGSVYASFNKGFKAGGYNSPNFGAVERVEPEEIETFEVGAKWMVRDNLSVDLALFSYDWENLQIAIIDTGSLGISQENAAGAKIDGFESSLRWAPSEMVEIGLGYSYIDGEYVDYGNASGFMAKAKVDADGDGVADDPTLRGMVKTSWSLTGHRTSQTPKNSFSADIKVNFPVAAEWNGKFVALAAYTDSYDMIPGAGGPEQLTIQPEKTVVNLTLDLVNENLGVGVQLFVDNATDEKYLFESQTTNYGGYQGVQFPRVFGARLRKSW